MTADLFDSLRRLALPAGTYAVFGSGPLAIRGLIDAPRDLDVICTDEAWRRVRERGREEYLADYDVTVVSLCDGALTFGTSWAIGDVDVPALIREAEIIDSLPFVRLEHVARYKSIRGSARDIEHLRQLNAAGFPVALPSQPAR